MTTPFLVGLGCGLLGIGIAILQVGRPRPKRRYFVVTRKSRRRRRV